MIGLFNNAPILTYRSVFAWYCLTAARLVSKTLCTALPKMVYIYIQAARSQDYINYDNFQLGRISRYWKPLQAHYIENGLRNKRLSADAWAKRLVYQLYQRMRSIWTRRCKIVHGSNGREISRRERKALKKEILK